MKTDAYTKVVLTIIAAAVLVMMARTFESPVPVFAQKAAAQAVQHVIIDAVGRSLPVTIEDVSLLMSRALPVVLREYGPTHVVIDDLGLELSLRGLPIKSPQHVIVDSDPSANSSGRWEYNGSTLCNIDALNKMAAAGWEFVQAVIAPDAQRQPFEKTCFAYFKRPIR
jgi:hypothetical protein